MNVNGPREIEVKNSGENYSVESKLKEEVEIIRNIVDTIFESYGLETPTSIIKILNQHKFTKENFEELVVEFTNINDDKELQDNFEASVAELSKTLGEENVFSNSLKIFLKCANDSVKGEGDNSIQYLQSLGIIQIN